MKKVIYAILAGLTILVSACDNEDVNKLLNGETEISIGMDKTEAELLVGETLQLTATVKPQLPAGAPKVIWSSSDNDVATVTTGDEVAMDGTYLPAGLVTAVGEGEAIITASIEGHEATCKITVKKAQTGEDGLVITPDKVTILKNETLPLSVTDAAGKAVKASWSSSDNMVAVVDENNVLQARNPGHAIVTATADGKSGTCEVEVTDEIAVESIAFNPDYVEMNIGDELQLTVVFTPENATDKTINHWGVLGGGPAVTVNENGLVKAVQKGTATVRAAIDPQRMADCVIKVNDPDNPDIEVTSITLNPTTATVSVNQEQPLILTATVTPPEALNSSSIAWKSSNPTKVLVEAISATQAKVAGLVAGSKETVTAYIGGKSATCEVTVEEEQGGVEVSSISLDHTTLDLTVGQTAQLTPTVLPESAAGVKVTWSSSNQDVAFVTNDSAAGADGSVGGEGTRGGMVVARSAGTATITASAGGKTATCQVTVSGGGGGGSSTLQSVSIDPASVTLSLNEEKSLSLVMVPADAEVSIFWQSSDSSIAKVQMTSKTTAKVQGVAAGQATLTVRAGELTATCAVTVQSSGDAVHVTSVTLNKKTLELSVGEQFQLVATVLPENATEKGVVWSSNVQTSKLYIDGTGMVTGMSACEATVTVRCKDNAYIYDECRITVKDGSSGSSVEAVDLGLTSGLKWCTVNVGASNPEDYGNYYAWAETSPKASYTSGNYKYPATNYGDGITVYKKYDSTPINGDGKKVLEAEDDAATVNMGSGWRTPTFKEFKELREECTWTWTTVNKVSGALVTGPNGKSIFLPGGGWYEGSTLKSKGSYGSYWTASGDGGTANAVDFANGYKSTALVPRSEGRSVRPVKD